jgi:release factor glutamine methyltransferase
MSTSPPTLSLADVTGRLRLSGSVFAEEEAKLLLEAARSPAHLVELLDRRVGGLPLEHVLGWAEFCGGRVEVDPGVFVPRRRTQFLADQAIALVRPLAAERRPVVVDLCCGSGAIGVAVASALGNVDLHATDIDPAAVRCARRNVIPAGGQVYEGDLYRPLPESLRGHIDLLVVNAPYVPTDAIATMPPEARIHEPLVALDGGGDGLEIQRRVIAAAPMWLASGGHLLIETSRQQRLSTVRLMADSGLVPGVLGSEELDSTVVIGSKG